jgi:REP element-mobilizing transposase RayT
MIHGRSLSARRHRRFASDAYDQRFVLITICTYQRRPVMGVVRGDGGAARVELSVIGEIVRCEWHASAIDRVAFAILPDHLHGIVRPGTVLLSQFIGGFKAAVTSRVRREVPDDVHRIWQRGYHDRLLRHGEVESAIAYIATNAERWPL